MPGCTYINIHDGEGRRENNGVREREDKDAENE